MPTKNLTQTTQVICYLTDCPIPIEDARRLILSDGNGAKTEAIQVFAHKDVLDFQIHRGIIQKTGSRYIAFV